MTTSNNTIQCALRGPTDPEDWIVPGPEPKLPLRSVRGRVGTAVITFSLALAVAMAVPRARTCCWVFSLSAALKILSFASFVFGAVYLTVAFGAVSPRDRTSPYHSVVYDDPNYKTAQALVGASCLLVGVALLIAALTKSLLWTKVALAATVIAVINVIVSMFFFQYWYRVIDLAVVVYCSYIVWSFHEMLKEGHKGVLPGPATIGHSGYRF